MPFKRSKTERKKTLVRQSKARSKAGQLWSDAKKADRRRFNERMEALNAVKVQSALKLMDKF